MNFLFPVSGRRPKRSPAQPLAALPPYGCGVPLAGTAKRVRFGEEEQLMSELCREAAKRGIWNLRRRGSGASSCHAAPVRDARLRSDSGHKQPGCGLAWFVSLTSLHPRCSRRLRASLSRCGGCATRGFPSSRAGLRTACAVLRSPSLRSIHAAPLASALLRIFYRKFRPP